jgi:hypothetical protein
VSPSFRQLTAIRRDDVDRFSLDIDPSSFIVRGPNGGYVAAVLLRSLATRIDDLEGPSRPPRSLTVHYPAAPSAGPATITTTIVRAGRSLVTAAATLTQDEQPMATCLAAFSPAWPGTEWTDDPGRPIEPPDEMTSGRGDRPPLPFMQYWDHRLARGLAVDPDGPAEVDGWIRLAEPEPVDGPVVAAIMDAFPPATFSRSDAPNPVPTVDLTVHFRVALPHENITDDAFLHATFRTRSVIDGFLEEDGELRTTDGLLVAQSRQLAIMLPG